MKINSKRQERNYIIIGLCAVLVIMGVGYAAFSQLLTINGTANISNSWCVGFDNTKESDYTAKAGITGGTTPTGSITFSGSTCETKYQPDASLTATFKQPGDQIEYTLTIKNKSTVPVAIKSIQVENNNVTTDTTIKKGNIEFIVHMPDSTNLAIDGETTMRVVARFQNTTDVTGPYDGEVKTLNVKINAEQGTGTDGMTTTFTGSIYRNNSYYVNLNKSPLSINGYIYSNDDGNGPGEVFDSMDDCISKYSSQGVYYCHDGIFGNYTLDANELGKDYYLKYDVVDDIITASYVCFVYDNAEHCLKGNINESTFDNKPIFNANTEILKKYQEYYNLGQYDDTTKKGCSFSDSISECTGGNPINIKISDQGWIFVNKGNGTNCQISTSYNSVCQG